MALLFHLYFLVGSGSEYRLRLKRLFILTCKQARMGTRQAASDREI